MEFATCPTHGEKFKYIASDIENVFSCEICFFEKHPDLASRWYYTSGMERSHPTLYWTLKEAALMVHPRSYLEIGTREGNSLHAVLGCAYPWLDTLILSDTWEDQYGGSDRRGHYHIEGMLNMMGYKGKVLFLDGDSKETIPKLQPYIDMSVGIDMALVDGDHSRDGATADLENVYPLIRTGGLILLDDIVHELHPYLLDVGRAFAAKHGMTIVAEDLSKPIPSDSGVMVMRK